MFIFLCCFIFEYIGEICSVVYLYLVASLFNDNTAKFIEYFKWFEVNCRLFINNVCGIFSNV